MNKKLFEINNRTVILLLLTLVYVLNFIDRTIVGSLSPFIKEDLNLTDSQLGLLKGFLFALFYSTIGVPVAWLADRYNRVKVVSISLALWSGFTAFSGLASNFIQLGLARLLVGIGEAGGSPPSHSIISDLYPKEERARALGVYALGIPVGVMFSFFLAGQLVESVGWRGTFIALGVPGVILALVIYLVIPEPKRGAMEGGQDIKAMGLKESFDIILKIKTWWGMCLAVSTVSFCSYALNTWGVDYVMRHDPDFDFGTLMNMLGLMNGVTYGLGTYFGAVLAEKWAAEKGVGGYAIVPGLALLVGAPALILAFWVDSIWTYLALQTIFLTASGFYLGPSFSIAQSLAPIPARAMSTALFFLVLNIIALGGGPTYIGFVSQALTAEYGETHALRLAMTTLIVPFLISIFFFFWTGKVLPEDWKMAQSRNESA